MKKTTVFKVLALSNFAGMLTLFLLFRAGALDAYVYSRRGNHLTSHNGGTPAQAVADTTAGSRHMLSSSESLGLTNFLATKKDSIRLVADTSKSGLSSQQKTMMYSSKSGLILDPKLLDSLRQQPTVEKKKKRRRKP